MFTNPSKLLKPIELENKFSVQSTEPVYLIDTENKIRRDYLDALRVLSVLAVVFIHVSSPLVESLRNINSLDWWEALLLNCASRWAVPVFVLISGSLLLDPSKDEPVSVFFRKRADRIIIPLAFWSAFFSISNYYHGMSLKLVLLKVFNGVPSIHLWFLYMILGLYIMTPPLRKFIQNSTESDRLYFIITALTLACPFSMYFQVRLRVVNVAFLKFIPHIGYFVCGYHLSRIDPKRLNLKVLSIILLGSFASMAAGTALLAKYTTDDNVMVLFFNHFSPPVIAMSISIFLIFLKIDSMWSSRLSTANKIFNFMAPYSLGIYIVHPMIIIAIGKYMDIWGNTITPSIGIPLTSLLTFAISFLIVYPIAKIPYLKKIVA